MNSMRESVETHTREDYIRTGEELVIKEINYQATAEEQTLVV
jgi:hypothetical protein